MSDLCHTVSVGPSDDFKTTVNGDVYAWNFETHPEGPQENTVYDLDSGGWELINDRKP